MPEWVIIVIQNWLVSEPYLFPRSENEIFTLRVSQVGLGLCMFSMYLAILFPRPRTQPVRACKLLWALDTCQNQMGHFCCRGFRRSIIKLTFIKSRDEMLICMLLYKNMKYLCCSLFSTDLNSYFIWSIKVTHKYNLNLCKVFFQKSLPSKMQNHENCGFIFQNGGQNDKN